MISSTQLARMIVVYSHVSKTKSINGTNGIAEALGMSPLMTINALNRGEKLGLFTIKRKKDGMDSIQFTDEQYDSIVLDPSNFGEDFLDFCEAIIEAVQNANSHENDMSRDQLMLWSGASPFLFTVAAHVLVESGTLAEYSITDSKDKKTSYSFLSLPENASKKWGKKQFKAKG